MEIHVVPFAAVFPSELTLAVCRTNETLYPSLARAVNVMSGLVITLIFWVPLLTVKEAKFEGYSFAHDPGVGPIASALRSP